MTNRTLLRIGTLAALALGSLWAKAPAGRAAQQAQTQSVSPAGQSATRLADGRWLLVGGEGAGATASVWDPQSGVTTPTSGSPLASRAWHSATLLSDGTVLIAGGRNQNGLLVETPEIFEPAAATFAPFPVTAAVGRASHSATLLVDGRVLVAGGTQGGPIPPATELWDLSTRSASIVGTEGVDRTGHTATAAADGRVLVSGGSTLDGQRASGDAIVDPLTGAVAPSAMSQRTQDAAPRVAASIPAAGASDVPADGHLALRFSDAMSIDSISSATVTLSGSDGMVTTAIIVAENGRLAFVWPGTALADDAAYELRVSGVVDASGRPVVPASIRFTTRPRPSDVVSAGDPEAWTPNLANREDGWRTNRPPSPWESLAPLMAGPGVTAVSGHVLRLDGRPLADVTLTVEHHRAHTDSTGRFLLPIDAGATRQAALAIDARTASRPNQTYGFYEAQIVVRSGQTNVLPFTIWSPLIDTAHQVTIPSPTTAETVVTTPTMPGLELHLPAGTVITDEEKKVVRTLTMTPIPLDRTPFPMPDEATFTMFFTIQPGGAYLATPGAIKGAWLVYPNLRQSPVGKRVQFFDYDPDDKGWYPYGMGTVTATSVVPDAKTRIYGFTGASYNDGTVPPTGGASPPGHRRGDPVDPSTGAFILTKTDLALPDVMPITLTRTYNSQDSYARTFGIGMTHSYGMFVYFTNFPAEGDFYQPDGAKLHFDRISNPSVPWYSTVLEHSASPTSLYKSRLTFWGDIVTNGGWQVASKDGTTYVFGHAAPLQAIRDRFGNETRLTWSTTKYGGSGYGTLLRITSPNGKWIAFTYGAGNRVSQVSDNLGRTVTYVYDASGRLSTVTDPENNVTTYTWNASNQLVTVKDGRNIVYLTNEYTSGRVTKQTLADPAAYYTYAYTTDPQTGVVTQTDVRDPNGHVERLTFDPATHAILSDTQARTTAQERTTTYELQAGSGFVTAMIDGLSRRTEYTYDGFGHVLTTKRAVGTSDEALTTFSYEPTFFQLATVTDPLTHTWTQTYDAAGKLTGITDPLTHHTTIGLNGQGQVTDITDPLTHHWQVGYTGGDLTSRTNPLGATWTQFVDAGGRALSATDPLGRITRTTVDKLNRVTAVTDPLGGQTQFAYDPNSRVLSLTDALTHATGYTYDTSDRAATRTDPLQKAATYGYDLNGNLTQLTDRKGQITSYQYDARDRLTQVTFQDSSTITYTYDAGDRLKVITDSANSGPITRDYDGLDRLISETTPQGSISYTYDTASRRATMTVAGQTTVSYGYDYANRLTSITQGSSVVSFSYDDSDRRSTITFPNGIAGTYGYDNANQLTSLAYTLNGNPVGDLTYTYDLAGNRTSVGGSWARTGLPQALPSATYDAGNRIATWNGTTYSYDPNGNLGSDGLTNYGWNARNQLTSLSGATSGSFAYDGLGRRRAKTLSGSTSFLYDGLDVVQELTSGSPTANLLTGGLDEVFQRVDSSGARTLLTDALGSTLGLSDAVGTTQTQYTYEPFGATAVSGSGSGNPSQYTGRESDGTGLYSYRARYYNYTIGRFISEDPLGFGGLDVNVFAYAWNSPTGFVDPLGTFGWPVHVAITNAAQMGAGLAPNSGMSRQVAAVDRREGSFGTGAEAANSHAMSGMTGRKPHQQTCQEAFQATQDQLRQDVRDWDLTKALHTIQDSYSPSHAGYAPWTGGLYGVPSPGHLWSDFFPPQAAVDAATRASTQFLRDVLDNPSGGIDPRRYLAPNPCR